MKKELFVLLLFSVVFVTVLHGDDEYRPYPILYVHGIWADPGTWGAKRTNPPTAPQDNGAVELVELLTERSTINEIDKRYFRNLPYPYPGYSNVGPNPSFKHIFQEVIQFNPNDGSIDPDDNTWFPDQSEKLRKRIKEVLEEYHGGDWASKPEEAKIILIGHSMGAPAIRYALYEEPSLAPHVWKVITIGGTNEGGEWSTPGLNIVMATSFSQVPMIKYTYWIFGNIFDALIAQIPCCGTGNFWQRIWSEFRYEDGFWQKTVTNPTGLCAFYTSGYLAILARAKYKDRDAYFDLNRWSGCMGTINSNPAPSNIKYYWIVGKRGMADGLILTNYAIATAHIIATLGLDPGAWLELYGTGFADVWNHNSDLVNSRDSQNPSEKSAFRNCKSEVITVDGIKHGSETNQWNYFVNAIEDPPIIHLDSVVTIDDEVFPISGTIDTIPGFIRDFKGRLEDYLLANNTLKISCNYFFPRRISWPNDLGYDGNKFKVENISNQIYYGWNHIEITSKNILDDPKVTKTYELLVLGGPMVNIISPGWYEEVNPKYDTL